MWFQPVLDIANFLQILSKVEWSDYDVSGLGAERLQQEGTVTKIGRVVEESVVSYQTMALTAASVLAVGAVFTLRNAGRLRIR